MPPRAIGSQWDAAHDLDAAGHDQVIVTRGHPGGSEVHGLLRRPALAVDRGGRHALGKSGRDPPVAGHIGALLADLAHAAANDVVDAFGVHTRPPEQRGQGEAQEIRRVPGGQCPSALAEGGAHDVDDDGLSHLLPPRVDAGVSACGDVECFLGSLPYAPDVPAPADSSASIACAASAAPVAAASSRRAINESTALPAPDGSPS